MAVYGVVWAHRDALSNLDLIKTWEEISPCKQRLAPRLSLFFFFFLPAAFLFSFFFLKCVSLLFPGLPQLRSVVIAAPFSSSSPNNQYHRRFMFPPVIRLPSLQPLWGFWRVWIRSNALSLHSYYRHNDYDRTRWLLITQHSQLIDNVGVFCASSPCSLIAIHPIKWSSSLDRRIMNLICIRTYSYCIH